MIYGIVLPMFLEKPTGMSISFGLSVKKPRLQARVVFEPDPIPDRPLMLR
jgi:hypothetical protein